MADDTPPKKPKVIPFDAARRKHAGTDGGGRPPNKRKDDEWWDEQHRRWPDRFPSREDTRAAVAEFMEWDRTKHSVLKKWRERKIFPEPLWVDLKPGSEKKPVELVKLDPDQPVHFKKFFPVNEHIPAGCELVLSGFPPVEGLIEEEAQALFDPKSRPAERRHMYNFFNIFSELDPLRDVHEFTDSLDLGRGRKIDIRITAKSHKGIKHDAEGEFQGVFTDGFEIELTHTPALVKSKSKKGKGPER